MRVVGVVLAAGSSSRFGAPKLLAPLDGRPVLEHVLGVVRDAGLDEVVVVLGSSGDELEQGIAWNGERRVRNPTPEAGLSSSVRIGLAAVPDGADAALIVLGDQPRIGTATIARVLETAESTPDRPVVRARHAGDAAPNPVLVRRSVFRLADEAAGDRGLGPVLENHPELVLDVQVGGDNPDVDTPADLAAMVAVEDRGSQVRAGTSDDDTGTAEVLAERWAERVRANREQVERHREVPDGADFYGPVSSLFVADPKRSGDEVLDALVGLARAGERWLDIGSGAGRYALPLAIRVAEVVAIDPSESMLAALREGMARHGISTVRAIRGRWPPDTELAAELEDAYGPPPFADAALIAHVGYDIEAIGPFVDALEESARTLCVAILMEQPPAAVAYPFWEAIHGEPRATLPALPEFVALLRAQGRDPAVEMIELEARTWEGRDEVLRLLRRQLWLEPGGELDVRLQRLVDERTVPAGGGVRVEGAEPLRVGIVTWLPRPSRRPGTQ